MHFSKVLSIKERGKDYSLPCISEKSSYKHNLGDSIVEDYKHIYICRNDNRVYSWL